MNTKTMNYDDGILDRAFAAMREDLATEEPPPSIIASTIAAANNTAARSWTFSIREKLLTGKAAAAAIVGVFGVLALSIGGNGTASVSFAQVIEPIREAETLSYTETTQVEGRSPNVRYHAINYEAACTRRSVEGGRITITHWQPGFRMLTLDPATKTAKITESAGGLLRAASTPVHGIIDEVRDFQTGQETDLGTKQINGRKAVGFRLCFHGQDYDIWADAETGEPVHIECEHITRDGRKLQITITDIKLDVELADNLFSLDPPEGYNIVK